MNHSEDKQERKNGAAEDDFMAINIQSQIYTATEDTLFTKTTSTLSGTHSLVSISHRKLRIDCLFLCASAWNASLRWALNKCMGSALARLHILSLKSFRDQSGFNSKQRTLLQLYYLLYHRYWFQPQSAIMATNTKNSKVRFWKQKTLDSLVSAWNAWTKHATLGLNWFLHFVETPTKLH